MEENKKSKLGLGILIGVLVTLVICMGAFIVYDKVLSDDNNEQLENDSNSNQEENNENQNNNTNNDNTQEIVTLNYNIEGTMPNVKVSVNGKYVDVTATNIELVGKLTDVLVFKIWSMDYFSYYVVDKDANILVEFVGNESTSNTSHKKIELKGNFIGASTVDDNSIIIKSDIVASEPTYNSCNKNDSDIVEYTEKFNYLGNGEFSNSTITDTTTAIEYRNNNNINCQ